MLEVKYSTRFKKDLKVCQKRHYDMNLLQQVINVLAVPAALQPQNKDHSLTGSYIPHRECHIQPDWLLVYKIERDALSVSHGNACRPVWIVRQHPAARLERQGALF